MRLFKHRIELDARASLLLYVWLLPAILGMTIGCSAPEIAATSTPRVVDIATLPASASNPMPAKTPSTGLGPTGTPAPVSTPVLVSTPAISPTPTIGAISLSLNLLAPAEGAGVEVGAVRVLGVTAPDASVSINGAETEVAPDGTFQHDLILQEGINSIVATASSPSGAAASDNVLVLFVPRPEGVPLSVLFPQGLEVNSPHITVLGATRQDAVVGVNGIPVGVNSLGIFSTEVSLEEGANLVEVVAVDLEENVNFQTVVVFYIP